MDVGLEVAFAECGGWDTHYNQGTGLVGTFARNVGDLSNSIAAFWTDLEKYQDDLNVMTMTEFGRTVKTKWYEWNRPWTRVLYVYFRK